MAKKATKSKPAAKTAAKPAAKKAAKPAAKKAAKPAAKKAAKPAAKKAAKRKPNPALMKPVQPDAVLAVVVGAKPAPRGQITKKLWDYIKKNGLQDAKNKRNINADDALKAVFGGKKTVTMFEMTKLVSNHIA
jgi:chromatin remodeling complex protein RSC6